MQSNVLLFSMLGVVILALLLVVFDKVAEKQYPVLIFFLSLGLIYQLTLMTNHIAGTDIHYEYYFALQTYNNGYWDHTIGHSYNSAISISVFVPVVAKLLHIPLAWSFKVIPPLFLAGVPVVTYYIFRKEFDSKTAFLSVFFFISIPTMFLELSGLAKQAIGELFLISCLGLVVYNAFNKRRVRYTLICILGMLTAVSHYSMGGTLFCYLLGAIVLLPIGRYLFRIKSDISLKYAGIAITVFAVFSLIYYGWAAQGAPLRDIAGSMGITTRAAARIAGSSQYTHWNYPEPAVALALGADFFNVDVAAQVFRVFQYATQILIIVGCISMLIHYKRRSLGYLVFLGLSGVILGLVIFYPGFSPMFNASRFYNLILLFMAPTAVLGGKLVFRNYKILAIVVLIPYFLLTTGAVFEVSGIKDLTVITVPYSHALSAHRTDSTGLYTDNDIKARDWVKANNKFPVYGDMWGSTLLFEVQSNLGGVNMLLETDKWYVNCFVFRAGENEPDAVSDDAYIFLRERNTENREITYQTGVGLRKIRSYEDTGFDKVLEGRPTLYQAGNAIVYGQKED